MVAIGGAGTTNGYGDRPAGARVTADLPVTADQRLYVEVGGNGTSGGVHPAGGFNGGGHGGTTSGGGGGGASDIRLVAAAQSGTLESRLLVAGGAGGNSGSERRAVHGPGRQRRWSGHGRDSWRRRQRRYGDRGRNRRRRIRRRRWHGRCAGAGGTGGDSTSLGGGYRPWRLRTRSGTDWSRAAQDWPLDEGGGPPLLLRMERSSQAGRGSRWPRCSLRVWRNAESSAEVAAVLRLYVSAMKLRGYFSLAGLAVRDRFAREQRSRVAMPVDHQVMEVDQLVSEYHAGGRPEGSMRSVYEVCASAISSLLPRAAG